MPRFRFQLRSLLWLVVCTALSLGAYRFGREHGIEQGLSQRSAVGEMTTAVYSVGDLVLSPEGAGAADLQSLVTDVRTKVLPNTWRHAGGEAEIVPFPTNLAIVVSHDANGHERIRNYFSKRRERLSLLTAR